jgi:antitoxin FitA
VRQLIARIDDDLHARLKERAATERRSLNSLVTEALERAAGPEDARSRLRAKLRAEGKLYVPPRSKGTVASREEVIEALRGIGPGIVDELIADREDR